MLKKIHLSYISLLGRIVLRHLFAADGTETLFLRLRTVAEKEKKSSKYLLLLK